MEFEDDEGTSEEDFKPIFDNPYIYLSSDISISGKVILGSKGTIHIFARGFKTDSAYRRNLIVIVDDKRINQNLQIDQDGTIHSELKLPDELEQGEHTITLIQKIDEKEIASNKYFR